MTCMDASNDDAMQQAMPESDKGLIGGSSSRFDGRRGSVGSQMTENRR